LSLSLSASFSLPCSAPPRSLLSFPTRRSSDLRGPRSSVARSRTRARGMDESSRSSVRSTPPFDRGWVRAPSSTRSRSESEPSDRSEEHTSELQSHLNLVCRLLLEKKKEKQINK